MGKSNNLHNKLKIVYQRDNNLNNFLKEDEIQTLENINNCFIKNFILKFSEFIKADVQLISYSSKTGFYNSNKESIKNFKYFNIMEMFPYEKQSFIIFSYNFLSVMIDLLFGGSGNFTDKIDKKIDITSTEIFINKKIIKFITDVFSDVFKKYFSLEIKFTNFQIVFDTKKFNFDPSQIFSIYCFHLKIKNIKIFFSILIPLSILKKINKKIAEQTSKDNQNNIHINTDLENKIYFHDIYDIKLNISTRINDITISYDKFCNLLVGNILPIQNPNKIIGFIENRPIFTGNYKRFNEQTVVFIEKFVNPNLELNKDKEYSNE